MNKVALYLRILFSFSFFKCLFHLNIFVGFQMLRNCKVARVLPRIADCAKNDRSAVLRARQTFASRNIFSYITNSFALSFNSLIIFCPCRCCEYALLILEYWADAPEIQRSADLYEDFIKCCVADAMSEVCLF